MKYVNADRLKAEIERYENTAIDAYNPLGEDADFWHGKVVACEDLKTLVTSLQQEQAEVQNGKFVFPKYLYARTKDNKTIDMSYAPQDMAAIEYIRNDFVEQEQPQVADTSKMEQPEVDLEREIRDYFSKWDYDYYTGVITMDNNITATLSSILNVARHFYELGLNARKK